MEKKVRIGIIGCGGIANGKHMPSLKKVAEAEMVAFCDIIVERAEEAAKKYGMDAAGFTMPASATETAEVKTANHNKA